ncbi:MAG TPA: type III-B CRISPR-associated protein Cas10/Cmr2 [Negativicutes bacterium]|nr:type III-B CRISPR-associated protein Cas10/Cmr2 [Negativicutes bacterium]
MSSQQYLFLFSIGPVQSFIAQARKTRDLFAGSQIISSLIVAAMEEVSRQNSANTFIFPCKHSPSKPNRFLAKVNTDGIHGFGEAIETAARTRWMQLSVEAFQSTGLSFELQKLDEFLIPHLSMQSCKEIITKISSIACSQIAEFPDIYWAAISYQDENNYASRHDELGRLLGSVKNVRQFYQLDEPVGSRKCSLDGERTALFYREAIPINGKQRKLNFLSGESKSMSAFLDSGEALSAVSLVKRVYKKNSVRFPSTAQIALMNIIDERWEAVYSKCFEGEIDYQLFYEENLTEKNLESQGIRIKDGYDLEIVIRAIRDLTKEKRNKYYALILFDGDNFGKIWSGKILKERHNLEEFQQKLAEQLNVFALDAKKYLDDHKGRTVYTGGDDFLGFVNLIYLFEVMGVLRTRFDALVASPLRDYLKEGQSITFTAGVTVVHYKAPLSEVLGKARAIEKRAKDIPGKDAFGIAVMSRSGEIHEGYLRFNPTCEMNGRLDLVDSLRLLEKIVAGLKGDGGFSNTFIKSFEREMRNVMDLKAGQIYLSDVAVRTELERLLRRSAKITGREKENAVKDLLDVVNLLRQVSENISNLLSFLDICDFIRRETTVG